MLVKENIARLYTVSYTAWAFYTLALITIAPDFLWIVFELDTNPMVWGWMQVLAIAFGLIGRVIDQPPKGAILRRLFILILVIFAVSLAAPVLAHSSLTHWFGAKHGSEATKPTGGQKMTPYDETAVFLVPLVKKWEGKHPCPDDKAMHCSYFDTIAKPPLWTVGFGHTETAAKGQRLTETQASNLLAKDLQVYWDRVRSGFTQQTKMKRLPPRRDAAFASLGYNVGTAGVKKSTATRRLNAGDIAGACIAVTWWNKAGGRVVRGLSNRRNEEFTLCMHGLV